MWHPSTRSSPQRETSRPPTPRAGPRWWGEGERRYAVGELHVIHGGHPDETPDEADLVFMIGEAIDETADLIDELEALQAQRAALRAEISAELVACRGLLAVA